MTDNSKCVFVFNSDGEQKFVLKSKPEGKLGNTQGLAVTKNGKYVIVDGSTDVKVFETDGSYIT